MVFRRVKLYQNIIGRRYPNNSILLDYGVKVGEEGENCQQITPYYMVSPLVCGEVSDGGLAGSVVGCLCSVWVLRRDWAWSRETGVNYAQYVVCVS